MYFFCLQIDGPITEGRGVISGSFWFKRTTGMTTHHLIRGHSSINPDTLNCDLRFVRKSSCR